MIEDSVSVSSSSSPPPPFIAKEQQHHQEHDKTFAVRPSPLSDDCHNDDDAHDGSRNVETNLAFGIPCCRACRHLVERDNAGSDLEISSEHHHHHHQQQSETTLRFLSFRPLDHHHHNNKKKNACATFTPCQVRQHNHVHSAWIVVGLEIYDITSYVSSHPGGVNSLLSRAGGACDCTRDFKFHSKRGQEAWEQFRMGRLVDCPSSESAAAAPPLSRSPWGMWTWNQ
ncbi:hypothetical protein ACA910_008448 [Epithemia clementina (nom. ined.)]